MLQTVKTDKVALKLQHANDVDIILVLVYDAYICGVLLKI